MSAHRSNTLLTRVPEAISAVLVFALMILTVLDVIGRNLMNRPLPGATELTELILPLVVFLLLPAISLGRRHIEVDLIDRFSGPGFARFQTILGALLGTVFLGLMAWQFWVTGNRAASYNDVTTLLRIPVAPAFYALAVCAAISALASLMSGFASRPPDPHASHHQPAGDKEPRP